MTPSARPSAGDGRFSEQTLADLLGALRARATSHPQNPGLIACWPAIEERQMAAACAELLRLGYPVERVPIAAWGSGKTRSGWALEDSERRAP
jgi:hypothetical protein